MPNVCTLRVTMNCMSCSACAWPRGSPSFSSTGWSWLVIVPRLTRPVLLYLEGDKPLWWESTIYRGDAYEFHNRLGSRGAANAAALTLD